jgi:hypothetical protein
MSGTVQAVTRAAASLKTKLSTTGSSCAAADAPTIETQTTLQRRSRRIALSPP